MDFNDCADLGPEIAEFLENPHFEPNFNELELDCLLDGQDESHASDSSASFGYTDQNAGFRSRDGGSLGESSSSSDSSPPMSCTNFAETDQEMWEFGFQNPNPFENYEQQYNSPPQQTHQLYDEQIENHKVFKASPPQEYVEYNDIPYEEEVEYRYEAPKYVSILPKRTPVVRRVVSRPIQKYYRIKQEPQSPIYRRPDTYRAVTLNLPPNRTTQRPAVKYSSAPVAHRQAPVAPKQHRKTEKIEPEEPRYIPIAPQQDGEAKPTIFTSEQNRKIRNRMYAQASRMRKRELEETMRQTIAELQTENEILKTENTVLKQRISFYEPDSPEREFPVSRGNNPMKKKMFAAGSALMMLGLFAVISPFNAENQLRSQVPDITVQNETLMIARHSRVLALEDRAIVDRANVEKSPPQLTNHHYSNSTHNDCEMYKLNATEARRVNNDIERWVQVHSFDNVPVKHIGGLFNKEAMRKFNEAQKQKKSAVYGPKTLTVQQRSEQAARRFREKTWQTLDQIKTGNKLPSDYEKVENKSQDIAKIASIVRQKGDTLYIMTLQDYVLLPSLKKGANSIPKISFLLPSVPMNGTLQDQYTLLRVDCEVTGTGQLTLSNKQLSYLLP